MRFLLPENQADPSSPVTTITSQGIGPRAEVERFRPYLGNTISPLDVFICSQRFEILCAHAMVIATQMPIFPPPQHFVSVECTVQMHPWYRSLSLEFVDCFRRILRGGCSALGIPSRNVDVDEAAFAEEEKAHIRAILTSINKHFRPLLYDTVPNISIDDTQPNARAASAALLVTLESATESPPENWKHGQSLQAEHRRRLRSFRAEVVRLLGDREDTRWVLNHTERLDRGLDAYEEYYMRQLREMWMKMAGAPTAEEVGLDGEIQAALS